MKDSVRQPSGEPQRFKVAHLLAKMQMDNQVINDTDFGLRVYVPVHITI